ncbi:MAG: helix-turn-helix transcriptional regulator [Alphaproteobacteria bacterium]|nr:helix-turn-helix transcriptional regulator [Alphaproteobacteria bacterium]
MGYGTFVRNKRTELGISLNDFASRLELSTAYWSRVERELDHPPRDDIIEKSAAILGIKLDDLFLEADRFPPDMQKDKARIVQFYRRSRAFNRK